MRTSAIRDPSSPLAVGAVAAATASGWIVLLSAGSIGLEQLCGPAGDGIASGLGLAAMWGLMAATMMLPCAIHEIVAAARDGGRAAVLFVAGYLAPTVLVVAATGVAGSMLESLVSIAAMRPGLLAVAGAALVIEVCGTGGIRPRPSPGAVSQGWLLGRTRLGSAVAMSCLQLAAGAMDLGWMAVLAAWMFALALAPARPVVSALAGVVLVGVAVFGSL